MGLPINPNQLNPILSTNTIEAFVDGIIFSQLVQIDDTGHEIPDLAEVVPTLQNHGISADGKTITYHLRRNVRWHDGAPFTSADVKYTVEQILNPRNNVVSKHGYDDIASVETPDPATVVLHMKQIFPPAIDTIFGQSDAPFYILPKHLLARYASLNDVPFNSAPVGTGPFRFARWERNDRIALEANDTYFRGAPKLKHLVLRIVLDTNTTLNLLRTRELDVALETGLGPYHQAEGDAHLNRMAVTAPSYESLVFNLRRPPFDDLRVRHAIALAVDRATLLKKITFGVYRPAIADLSPFSWAYDRSIAAVPYDPVRAKAELDAAGWQASGDAIRAKGGKPLALQITFPLGDQQVRNMAVDVAQMLRGVGIDASLKGYQEQLLYAAAGVGGIYNGGKFDIGFYPWVAGADPDDSGQWSCATQTPVGWNVTHYCSAAMDAAQARALSTFDRKARVAAYGEIQRQLVADIPALILSYRPSLYVLAPDVQNFRPNGISEGWNAQEWNR